VQAHIPGGHDRLSAHFEDGEFVEEADILKSPGDPNLVIWGLSSDILTIEEDGPAPGS